MPLRRTGQSTVEVVLGMSILAVAIALGFVAFGDVVRGVFHNARNTAELPYP